MGALTRAHDQSEQPLRLALIGLGNQGQEHLGAARNSDDVVFVSGIDPNPGSQEAALAIQPALSIRESVKALAEEELDGLVIALPHHCYADIWADVLALGLPILKEKPLGRSFDESLRLLQQAREAGCMVQTAIQRRHHGSYQAMKRHIQASGYPPLEAHAHLHLGFDLSKNQDTWRSHRHLAGGGALLDAGYHLVDLLHYLVGPFDLVAASLWQGELPVGESDMDDRALLVGRGEQCWVTVDSCVGMTKSEEVRIRTDDAVWSANREGLWRNGECISTHLRDWEQAMCTQLHTFADNIRHHSW
uniref:Gfo/Idh/MocA family protein n=1 Tax=uncultured Halomonas sp. TaxID=173971 RepID=UPI00260EAA80